MFDTFMTPDKKVFSMEEFNAHIQKENFRVCENCSTLKGVRDHHCSQCGFCVEGMDHHCTWMNVCISQNNLKFFYNYLVAQQVFLGMALGMVISHADLIELRAVPLRVFFIFTFLLAILLFCFNAFILILQTK